MPKTSVVLLPQWTLVEQLDKKSRSRHKPNNHITITTKARNLSLFTTSLSQTKIKG